MAMDYTRITAAAKAELLGYGMKPDDVPFGTTGKGALELIVDAIAKAVINEITTNGVVSTTVAAGIAVQVTPATGTGATTAPGSGTGNMV